MAVLNEPLYKHLTASGAVTTNNKGGRLLYAHFTSDTAGDKLEINDGATTQITLLVPAANGSDVFNPARPERPIFRTDIDAVITSSNNPAATFIYDEIQQ